MKKGKGGEPPHVRCKPSMPIASLFSVFFSPSFAVALKVNSLSLSLRGNKTISTYLCVDVGLEAEEEALVAADKHRRRHVFFFFVRLAFCFFLELLLELSSLLERARAADVCRDRQKEQAKTVVLSNKASSLSTWRAREREGEELLANECERKEMRSGAAPFCYVFGEKPLLALSLDLQSLLFSSFLRPFPFPFPFKLKPP